jgi:hypothetical protein
MPNLDFLKFNKEKAEGGVWVDYHDDLRLKIAKVDNPRAQAAMRSAQKLHKRALQFGDNEKLNKKIAFEVTANCVLLGWEGMTETNEKDSPAIPYSPEAAIKMFEAHESFFVHVTEFAKDRDLFQDDDLGK